MKIKHLRMFIKGLPDDVDIVIRDPERDAVYMGNMQLSLVNTNPEEDPARNPNVTFVEIDVSQSLLNIEEVPMIVEDQTAMRVIQ